MPLLKHYHPMAIKPLKLGNLHLPTNLIQGPLAGYTCSAYREMVWEFGHVAYCTTEMLSAIDLVTRKQQRPRYVHRAENEKLLAFQLAGNDPAILAKAAHKAVSQYQADIIDLNCGCPKTKIRKKGYGSKLIEDQQLIVACVKAMRDAIDVPLTVKIRLTMQTEANITLVEALQAAGADGITIHPRNWQTDYDTPCDWQQVRDCVQAVNIPIIANGDIKTREQLEILASQTGCAGFMISRASTGAPWLFQQLSESEFTKPKNSKLAQLLLNHVTKLIALENETRALLQTRTLAKYYARHASVHDAFFEIIKQTSTFEHFAQLVKQYYK